MTILQVIDSEDYWQRRATKRWTNCQAGATIAQVPCCTLHTICTCRETGVLQFAMMSAWWFTPGLRLLPVLEAALPAKEPGI